MEDLRKQAEVLVEERRLARVQTLEWSREAQMESDEERERKSKKMLGKGREWQGDEAGEQKKKKRGKLRKEGGGGVDQALFSNG